MGVSNQRYPTRRFVLQAGVGAAAAGLTTALFPSASCASDAPIRIGCLNVYTKAGGMYGQAIYDGLRLYLQEHDGRIAGRPVELIKEDDEFNPQVALQKIRKLVEGDKVHLVAGPLGSHIATAITSYLKRAGTPWLVTGAGATELTKLRLPNMFRVTLSDWQVAGTMGGWAAGNLPREAAIIAPDYITGHDVADCFKAAYVKGGGKIAREIYTPNGTNDFGPYLTDLRASLPPMVYVFYSGSDAVRFVQQFDKFGLKGKTELVGFQSTLDSDTFREQGASAVGGLSSSIYCETLDSAVNRAFVELFRKVRGHYPGVFDESGYTAMRIVDDAARRVDGRVEDTDAFLKALAETDVQAPRGPVRFDPLTHQAIQNVYIRKAVEREGHIVNEIVETFVNVGDSPANRT